MKTRFILMAMFATLAISCAKEILPENNVADNTDVALVSMEFVAGLESKAAIVDGEKTVEWVAGDQICVFDNLGGDNAFKTEASGKTVSFAGQVSGGANEFYALYPYRSGAEFDAETKVVTSKLFPEQKAVLGSYAKAEGGAVMAAKVSDGNVLSFKNMTSHIRFTLAEDLEDVISITLMGNKGEALAGLYTVDFNGEVPVLTVSKAETYITLRNEDESVLEPGDYFFTVLPVEFTEGFTVILSMSDGSQLAKKTTKSITSLGERNKVLPMAKLNYSDYKPHMNYFVRYNDGFELTFGGYTFDKTTQPDAKLVNDTYGNGNISTDGVYFVDPSCTTAQFNKAQAYSSIIVVGSEAGVRTDFEFYRQARPFEGGSLILLANLDCTIGDKNAFGQNTKTEGHAFKNFGDLILYDCHFRNVGKNFFEFKDSAISSFDLHVELCEFGLKASALYLFNVGSNASTVQSWEFINNIFYVESGSAMTDFKLTNGDALTIDDVYVDKNTFANTVVAKNIIKVSEINKTLNFTNNLFVECSSTSEVKLIALNPGSKKTEITGIATNNYYYTTGSAIGLGVGKSALTSMDAVNSTAVLDASPLNSNWQPAEGTYGPYVYDSDVSNKVGAWRDDMKVAAEPANYAAAGYSSVNLGNY